ALLLGKTGAVDAAALVRHGKRDIADSGHKFFWRLSSWAAHFTRNFRRVKQNYPIFPKKSALAPPKRGGHARAHALLYCLGGCMTPRKKNSYRSKTKTDRPRA
ncbi:MAG: hypothetical protein MJ058_09615, partial [Akkermansia sp.]|nr:hypothetical protein [Akkermansia sp.]